MTEESKDTYAINGSYTGSNYGVSITYGSMKMAFFLHLKKIPTLHLTLTTLLIQKVYLQ